MKSYRVALFIVPIAFLAAFRFADSKQADLEDILKKAAAYSARLESAALNFTCTEQITETQTLSRRKPAPKVPANTTTHAPGTLNDISGAVEQGAGYSGFSGRSLVIRKNKWLYDYQLVRKQRVIDERRTLLKWNGQDKKVENAPLNTFRVWFKDVIMCPAGLFSAAAQQMHIYKIVGRETIYRIPAAIIDVQNKPGIDLGLSGKAWVSLADGAVLKVEWTADSLRNSPLVTSQALDLNAVPRITLQSEFGAEKNGIRFLSEHRVIEAYFVREARKVFTRSKLDVSYKDYRYFTVETNVDF